MKTTSELVRNMPERNSPFEHFEFAPRHRTALVEVVAQAPLQRFEILNAYERESFATFDEDLDATTASRVSRERTFRNSRSSIARCHMPNMKISHSTSQISRHETELSRPLEDVFEFPSKRSYCFFLFCCYPHLRPPHRTM